jgi:hypothetical protein
MASVEPGPPSSWHEVSRPLTEDERTRFRQTMAPVLRDIEASGAIAPIFEDETSDSVGDDFVSVMVWSADGTGMGVFVPVEDTAAERVARLADQVQEWEIEELAAVGRPATWPECPDHPDSHPLEPVVADDTAVWRCPRSGHVISQVGALSKNRPPVSGR